MSKSLRLVLATALLGSASAGAVPAADDGPSADLASRLRAEAERLASGSASDPLRALAGGGDEAPAGLTDEQVAACKRLDETARAVIRAWLVRGLDRDTPPPAGELSARLGERGARLRQLVVAHAEAIAIEGILSPAQSRRWRPAKLTAARPLAGRYGLLPSPNDKPPETILEVDRALRFLARRLADKDYPASLLFGVMAEPGATSRPTPEQAELIARLDEVARLACRATAAPRP